LSFNLKDGQALQLIGANGSGKTSLLRQLAGFLPIAVGEIRYSLPKDVIFIPAYDAFFPEFTVEENIKYWCHLWHKPPTVLEHTLEMFSLKAVQKIPMRFLSQGQKRRVSLSRLLLHLQAIWLLDEPLNGLDKEGAHCFLKHLEDHLKKSNSALIASHHSIAVCECTIDMSQYAVFRR